VKHHGNGLELSKVANSWLLLRYTCSIAFSQAWRYDIANCSTIAANDALAPLNTAIWHSL
jgi:hypothetical protein